MTHVSQQIESYMLTTLRKPYINYGIIQLLLPTLSHQRALVVPPVRAAE